MVPRRSDTAVWVCLAWGCFAFLPDGPSCARAQVVMAVPVAESANPNDPTRPFNLPAQKTEVTEALTEFNRLSARGAWERAFKELEKVQQAPPTPWRLATTDFGCRRAV